MKLLKLLFGTVSASILLSSCLTTFRGDLQQSGFAINDCDFQIVQTIEGRAKATYIFGIGGNLRQGLVNDAKRNMYGSYKLAPNQQITNITTDYLSQSFIIPIFSTQTAIITADVIEFIPRSTSGNTKSITPQTEIKLEKSTVVKRVESTLELIKQSKNITSNPYLTINDVNQGDYVKVTFDLNGYKETLYGKVERVSGKSYLVVEFEPTPGTRHIEEHPLKNCEKIGSW